MATELRSCFGLLMRWTLIIHRKIRRTLIKEREQKTGAITTIERGNKTLSLTQSKSTKMKLPIRIPLLISMTNSMPAYRRIGRYKPISRTNPTWHISQIEIPTLNFEIPLKIVVGSKFHGSTIHT
mgnify:CR=1 FL=1